MMHCGIEGGMVVSVDALITLQPKLINMWVLVEIMVSNWLCPESLGLTNSLLVYVPDSS